MNNKQGAVKTDKEFSRFVPKLTDAEYEQLEKNIVRDGCREPLSLWKGRLLDGHYRYSICRKHKIEFKTVNIKLSSKHEATVWVIQNQLGRRNLTDFQKIEMVAHLEEVYAAKGKEHKSKYNNSLLPTLAKAVNTRKEMAKLAEVSTGQYQKGKEIIKNGTEQEKETLRHRGNGTTINKVCSCIRARARKEAADKWAKDRKYDKSSIESGIDLRLGDCVKILPTIADNSVDLVLTDPPYNVGLEYDLHNDSMPDENYYLWCKQWLIECCRVLKDRHYGIIFTGDKKSNYVHKAIDESGLTFHHFIKWFKPGAQGSLSGSNLFYRTELAFLVSKGKPDISLINRKEFYQDTIILKSTTPNQADAEDHPARRPVDLYKLIINGFTQQGDTVLDCFLGSGSNGCAANELDRRFIGIEISPKYLNMAKRRIDAVGNSPKDIIQVKK